MTNFHERWGIKIDDDQRFSRLKNRLIVVVGSYPKVSTNDAQLFAFSMGKKVRSVSSSSGYDTHINFESLVESTTSKFELAELIEKLLNTVSSLKPKRQTIINFVNSSGCGIRLTIDEDEDRIISFPEGEKTLDEELVEKPFSFLDGKAAEEMKKALENYTEGKWEQSAEKIRRTLEEYLRALLGNKKGLEGSIKELGSRLKEETNVPVHLRTAIINTANTLDKTFNESSKHNSKTHGDIETEFLLYKTGLLINLLSKIKFTKKEK